jgi:hypothetical protein
MRYAPWILLLLGCLLRVGYVSVVRLPPNPDEVGYELLGANLAAHHELAFTPGKPTAAREPGYPFFIALVYSVAGRHPAAVRVAQALVGSLSCYLAFLLAGGILSRRGALLVLSASSVYPALIYFTGSLMRETLLTALLLAMALAALPLLGAPTPAADDPPPPPLPASRERRQAALLGLAGGAAALVNSVALPVLAAYLALLAGRRKFAAAALALAACAVLYAPWVARNWRLFGVPVLGSTNGGKTFWDGTGIIPFDVRGLPEENRLAAGNDTILRAGRIASETARDRFYFGSAWDYIRLDPGRYALQTARKFAKFWRLYPHPGRSYGHRDLLLMIVGTLSFGPVLLGSLAALPRGGWRRFLPLAPAILTLPLVYTIFWSQLRYRLPLEALLIIPAAGTLDRLLRRAFPAEGTPPTGAGR